MPPTRVTHALAALAACLAGLLAAPLAAQDASAPLRGDVDADGRITTLDAQAVTAHAAGGALLEPARLAFADADADGRVSTRDALIIEALARGRDVSRFPVGGPLTAEELANGPVRWAEAPPGSLLAVQSGDGRSGVAGERLAAPLALLLTGPDGTPLSGVLVTWTVEAGGGAVRAARTGTGPGGVSANSWTLGPAGEQRVAATVAGAGSVVFTATAVAPAGLVLRQHRGDGLTGIAGDSLGTTPQVRVFDPEGRPAAVKLEWHLQGGGSAAFTHTVTDHRGASENPWVLGPAGTPQRLVARLPGGDSAVFGAFSVAARDVRLSVVGGDAQAGAPGDSLPALLRVLATAGGRPVSALVRWEVATEGGALRAAVVSTDAAGYAANRWRLAAAEGPQAARAALPGAAPLTFTATATPRAAPRPNVLFIIADDLGDWVGYLNGHPGALTPNLDRLARMGVAFERAYAPAPLCNPSRSALLTGVRPSTSGIYVNGQTLTARLPGVVTLPELFRRYGYHTVGIGKVFHQAEAASEDSARWERYVRPAWPEPVPPLVGPGQLPRWGVVDVGDEAMSDHRGVNEASAFLARPHDRPFFLAVGLYRPHYPWHAPRRWFDLHPLAGIRLPEVLANDLDDVPPAGVAMAGPAGPQGHAAVIAGRSWEEGVRAHLASISFMDAQLGRLLDALEASPHRGNTIVVFLGDHGVHLGEKSHWLKSTLWEESTRAPLVFVVPGLTPAGGRSPRTVDFMALYPTLAELAGIPLQVPQAIEGHSIRPLLANPQAPWDQPAVTTFRAGNHAVRSERWRYIRYADGSEELYDHATDPNEWHNLAGDPALAGVKASLRGWMPQ
ncbi:MAG TPA: sulfatase-like hydrolase/transferase [Longimicrobium sp.]|nr:sulfatase-like hydrolase/transferase [Longimicrobium sp.]